MTLFNYKKYISFVLIVAVAVVTGLAVGKIYVDTIEPIAVVSAKEEDLREKDADVLALVKRANSGASATSFSAVELYNIAEYKLYHADKYFKLMTGTVFAPMGIKQPMRGEKLHRDGKLVYNKLSPSSSSLSPSICSRILYDYETQITKINPKGTFDKSSSEIKGVFDDAKFQDYTLEQYKETFNTIPTNVLPYIISSKTCAQKKTSAVTANGDGTFSFRISIDGDYLALSGLYYAYEIKFSSGMQDPPKWVSLTMDVTVDSNFNFSEIKYVEVYKMNVSGIGLMQVTDEFVDHFEFENVPEIEEVL